ncbi:Putative ribonuclease H protein At1g65750 [Linum perenne]
MMNQAQSWKSRLHSSAGKAVLIKSVIQAIASYIMSLFILPAHLIKRMNSLLRKFFWSGSMERKSIHWRDGNVLSDPKSIGGLGFREFSAFNMAIVAK